MAEEKKTNLEGDDQPPKSRRRISRRAFLAGAAALGAYAAPTLSLLPLAEAQIKGSPPKDEKDEKDASDKGAKDGTDKGSKDGKDKAETDKNIKDETDKGSKDGKDMSDKDKTEKDAKTETAEFDTSGMLVPGRDAQLTLAAGRRRDEWS
jgi:hypothetical protein